MSSIWGTCQQEIIDEKFQENSNQANSSLDFFDINYISPEEEIEKSKLLKIENEIFCFKNELQKLNKKHKKYNFKLSDKIVKSSLEIQNEILKNPKLFKRYSSIDEVENMLQNFKKESDELKEYCKKITSYEIQISK